MDYQDVLELARAIPPRKPRGSPENKLRNGPIQRWLAAKRRYEEEHGQPWHWPSSFARYTTA